MFKQLSIFVENEVGIIAQVTDILQRNSINIRAISSYDAPEFAILRTIVNDPERAKAVLAENSFVARITDVVAIELDDKPGELNRVLSIIAEAGLHMNYIYSLVLRENGLPLIILHMDNMSATEDLLSKNGIKIVD